uniref:Uncharacterized protein n=1 Tax=Timema bartmani TaxID=61472 RepID=A0A7R9HZU0_9NEOP|nr:unnamed protein product [Timema bartmani]
MLSDQTTLIKGAMLGYSHLVPQASYHHHKEEFTPLTNCYDFIPSFACNEVIRLSTNYASGLGIGKVEFRASELAFAWMESGKQFKIPTPQIHPTEIRTSISLSSAVWLNTKLALVRAPGYRSIGVGFNSRCFHIFCGTVGLEPGQLSLVKTNK